MEAFEVIWRCMPGLALAADPETGVRLQIFGQSNDLPVQPSLAPFLLKLNNGASESEMAAAVGDDYMTLALLLQSLARLRGQGLLEAEAHGPKGPWAVFRPVSRHFEWPASIAALPDAGCRRLSRFASLHRMDDQWVLECSEASCMVFIKDPGIVPALMGTAEFLPKDGAEWRSFKALLADQGFLEMEDEGKDVAQRSWTLPDRQFHKGTRCLGSLTGVIRAPAERDELLLPAEIRPAHPGQTIDCPPVNELASGSLADVMNRRRSTRSMDEMPANLQKVAALLYRSVRVTAHSPSGFIFRPYPSGGAMHELEFYLAVRECEGLGPGFYHYRSDAHTLTCLNGPRTAPAAATMIRDCAWAWNQPDMPPQCLIVITTRYPRVAYKYRNIAYRLSLLSVGAVLQNLYLVATDLGLNGCAAGSGRPELFAEATGLSTWEETSVAEFGFGNPPTSGQDTQGHHSRTGTATD